MKDQFLKDCKRASTKRVHQQDENCKAEILSIISIYLSLYAVGEILLADGRNSRNM
jgi:hypothetical protein